MTSAAIELCNVDAREVDRRDQRVTSDPLDDNRQESNYANTTTLGHQNSVALGDVGIDDSTLPSPDQSGILRDIFVNYEAGVPAAASTAHRANWADNSISTTKYGRS